MSTAGAWRVETTTAFERDFKNLDAPVQKRIAAYLVDISGLPDPRLRGKALTGNHRGHWRYRVGDCRIIVTLDDGALVILALIVAKRSEAY
jgi:mRNA interferase RelE/StbE